MLYFIIHFADFDFHNPKACSTAQLIYEFTESYGDLNLIDATIGECIYTGIITDTGSLRIIVKITV